jgi:hypothetical protein
LSDFQKRACTELLLKQFAKLTRVFRMVKQTSLVLHSDQVCVFSI